MVVDADAAPERILQACKAYATRALKGLYEVPRDKYWTRSGDVRRLDVGRALASAIHYVLDGQGAQMEIYAAEDRVQHPPIIMGASADRSLTLADYFGFLGRESFRIKRFH